MKLLYDFFPVLAFFVAYKVYDIFVATAVIIVASVIQITWHWHSTRRVSRLHLTTAALVLLFGGVTLILRDQTFIQWKPTVVNWLFGIVFLGSQFVGDKPVVQRMLEVISEDTGQDRLPLSSNQWVRLNSMWVGFFAVLGAINLYVVYNFSENTWVNFKLFGMLGLTLAFLLIQGAWLARQLPHDDESA